MSENVGKIQIVIKGGKPWGFRLKSYSENRSAVTIDHIEPGGKAELNGDLKIGDHVIKINDVLCLSLADALQLIDSAFRTLTILVWRPTYFSQAITNNKSTELQNYSNVPFSSSVNKLNGPYFQKFHALKCNVAVPRVTEKSALKSSGCKNEDSANSLQYQFSKTSQYLHTKTISDSVHKPYPKDSFNKSKNFNEKFNGNSECFNPLLSQCHQSTNLQYICEQYPLSELFLNHKSDLKLESLSCHSKRTFKTYQCPESYIKTFDNPLSNRDTTIMPKETYQSTVSDCVCCMYPKCHSSYKNCKMHSPPERDLEVFQANVVDQPIINNLSANYEQRPEEKYRSDTFPSTRIYENHLAKKLNFSLHRNSFKIKEDGFKNSDLKIFKPVELSVNSKPLSPNYDHGQLRRKKIFSKEQISVLAPTYSFCSSYKDKQKFSGNKIQVQKFSTEIIPDISVEHVSLINHSEQNKLAVCSPNTVQKENTALKNTYQRSYVEEKQQTVCLGVKKNCTEFSNEASIVSITSVESSKSDGDEDEELCLIEENARNNYSCKAPNYSSVTPDIQLPPPSLKDETPIISINEPLPSPLSFSPVKEVIYENIEINKQPDEAIYANLEMLKIKCSVMNSATQTGSLQKSSDASESKQLSKQSFSFIETEIFSNIISPTFGNKFRSDYLQRFLQSQVETHSSVFKDNVIKSEEKYSCERNPVNLPLASAYFTTSEPKAKLLTRYISSLRDRDVISSELTNKKEELMTSINKKLGILRLEQIALKEEMRQNEDLGSTLNKKLEKVAQHNEIEKFKTHVEELEKITNLMISLSGRLARAENALLILQSDVHPEEKSILEEKYSKLNKQYEEAKYLKKNIDRRNCQVSMFLRKYFTEEEFADYDHFITMKAKLLVDCRELDEKIKLGEEQLDALKSSVNDQIFN